jgi:hypothetical protein
MGKFDAILDKLQKAASDRDAKTAKQKCPLRKKPAIYVAVVRGDTGDPVSSVQVDISKPTKQSPSTNGNGEIKVDPAKRGSHNLKVLLTQELAKQFAQPRPAPAVTSGAETAIQCFVLEPLPTLVVEVKDKDANKPIDGIAVRAGQLPPLNTSGGKADFGGIAEGKYVISIPIPKPSETRVEVTQAGAIFKTFERGYPVTWTTDLPSGSMTTYTVLLSKVRWVEFRVVEDGTDPQKTVPKITIRAKLPSDKLASDATKEDGVVRFENLNEGTVDILEVSSEDDIWEIVSMS